MKYDDMQQLIGNTPLVRLRHSGFPDGVRVYAKLELYNPSGSVKDRIGKYMIEDAEKRGVLVPGSTIVEGTAGNTGLGIAFAALNRGYRLIMVVPTKFSQEKQALLRALGAEVINTPREEGMLGAELKVEELRQSIPKAVSLEQFRNPANPLAHYETTGPEIWTDLGEDIDYFVAGAGSGGTYAGIVRYLKEQKRDIKGILADPIGSTMGGGEHGDYDIEGIGNDFIPDTMDMSLVDDVIKVSDDEAFAETRLLARNEGIIAGSSSGANLAAVRKLAMRIQGGTIVTVLPDRGERYLSKNLFL
ncbi:MAG TPA: cysteine synthase family protein [Acetivibrio sp.]|uniref:PLP-dependent cysteine synthase family protein n=1 Tax=Acetivibrio sp. TaxID=1872092 RepID=UPI002C652DFB|nr:cysteine synthase family protein [Acetivibrio sp.]HOM02796.1 cysteine synthase family protein [Acetivibrio sp.]